MTLVRTVTVTGDGATQARPDRMTISMGVRARQPTASAALADASRSARALIEVLTTAGVADADIATHDLSLYPTFDQQTGERLVGFEASTNLTVIVRGGDADAGGQLLDTAASAVGDAITLHGISFSIDEPTALQDAARLAAVASAKAKAEQLATANGLKLGDVVTINEGSGSSTPMFARASFAADSMPLQPGSQSVTASVTITYQLVE
jgi:uncharacterized protein